MNSFLRGAFVAFLLSPVVLSACVSAQTAAPSARSKGTIFKDEVDSLVGLLCDSARAEKLPALGGNSVLTTAKVLVAMGNCHRRYHTGDGPVVRPSLQFLIASRKSDGTFGDVAQTTWVVEALDIMDSEGFREEVRDARSWLAGQSTHEPGFKGAVERVLEAVRADVFPQHVGKSAAAKVQQWTAAHSGLPRDEAADVLVELVACQVANRQLDHQQDGAKGGALFSPAQEKAFAWLISQQKDGVFSVTMGDKTFPDPALTGFGLLALQTKPRDKRTAEEQATIEKGLKWLVAGQNADGTFGQHLPNYTTCVVVAALARWDDPASKAAQAKAQKALLGFQNTESNGFESGDRDYGSIGYGDSQRGDLSNLHFSIEALRATGLPPDHEAFQKALVFLQRTQNLRSVNDFSGKIPDPDHEGVMLDATSGDDGGAVYYPGNSAAGYVVLPDGKSVPRSYGSMTYALLKSYTLAGVSGNDPRVQAAVKWIQDNWTLAVNPGTDPALGEKVKYQGLFYYYMVLAQALDAAAVKTIKTTAATAAPDTKGQPATTEVDWRKELRAHLEGIQQADGTWTNGKNGRWMESLPLLCTCYAMAALDRCH